MVTLVGGSSTGKTRACWEAVKDLPDPWRLWHPFDPSRPGAAAAAMELAGPHTVVWLNEAQLYLAPTDPELAERVAAALRTLLQDQARGPVLVMATMWPYHWRTLTIRPGSGLPDPFAQARELLTGTDLDLPEAFTRSGLASLQASADDPRLRQALKRAENGRITQYLAGAPELLQRYRKAPPVARAILDAAIDARRLGHPPAIPHDLLARAAPGYLDDMQWRTATTAPDGQRRTWDQALEDALCYTDEPCHGTPGPLTPARQQQDDPTGSTTYRLADYLEQTGRHERRAVHPPESLWTAFAATVTDPALLRNLAQQARQRGRYQHALRLYTQSADRGDPNALQVLARVREEARDTACTEALAMQAADDRSDTRALQVLAGMRERAGDTASAEALAVQAADGGDTIALRVLAVQREQAGDTASAEALAMRAAYRGDTRTLRVLAALRERAGDALGAEALYRRAADRGDIIALWVLALRGE